MISEKQQNAINEQITVKWWSSNRNLPMFFYFVCEVFAGLPHGMKNNAKKNLKQTEKQHA